MATRANDRVSPAMGHPVHCIKLLWKKVHCSKMGKSLYYSGDEGSEDEEHEETYEVSQIYHIDQPHTG